MNMMDAGDFAINDDRTVAAPTPARAAQPAQPSLALSPRLEPFLLLAKSARGASAANLIGQVLSAPGVYVFSELLQMQGIADLKNNEQYASSHELLEIFAYGSWMDYRLNQSRLPALSQPQENKLKHLTVLSLAGKNRMIPYDTLLSSLDLPSVPALEDLLIEGIYASIFTGRLDQKEARVEIISSIGRDVRPTPILPAGASTSSAAIEAGVNPTDVPQAMDVDLPAGSTSAPTEEALSSLSLASHSIPSLSYALKDWLGTISNLLHSLDNKINTLRADAINEREYSVQHEARVTSLVEESGKDTSGKGKEKSIMGGDASAGMWARSRDKDARQSRAAKGKGADKVAPVVGSLMGASVKDLGEDEEMEIDAGGGSGPTHESASPGKGRPVRKRGRN